jgi:hypothetical protein
MFSRMTCVVIAKAWAIVTAIGGVRLYQRYMWEQNSTGNPYYD